MTHEDEIESLKTQIAERDAIDERFDRLERSNEALCTENKTLRAKVAALEKRGSRKSIVPPPRPLEGTRVFYPIPPSCFTMPSDEQLCQLADIVIETYPAFGDTSGPAFHGSVDEREADWLSQFKLSFRALGAMKRLAEPDRKHYLSHHIDACEAHLRVIGKSATLRGNPFMAAVLAWGDICFSGVGLQHEGVVVEIGLSEHVGRAASDASWKRVLETGQLLPMSRPARQPAPRSPSRVIVGGW
jgi:hypothetical protein